MSKCMHCHWWKAKTIAHSWGWCHCPEAPLEKEYTHAETGCGKYRIPDFDMPDTVVYYEHAEIGG